MLVPVALLIATCASTFFAGAMSWEPHNVFNSFQTMPAEDATMQLRQEILRSGGQGLVYMLCVISILFAHEMGHYIATRIYRIPSTLPFFIPFPIAPIGTMGAVIAMKGQEANRKEIFDIGIAGPAKLQTLIKFAIACGVGPSLKVLQKRAKDVTKLLMPFEPHEILNELAAHKAANPDFNIAQVHFFPLGGIKTNATWAIENGGAAARPAVQA